MASRGKRRKNDHLGQDKTTISLPQRVGFIIKGMREEDKGVNISFRIHPHTKYRIDCIEIKNRSKFLREAIGKYLNEKEKELYGSGTTGG